jgi:hypothetical protein
MKRPRETPQAGKVVSEKDGLSFYMPGKIDLTNINRRKKMRKFWIVLLSVGLIMAFTMPVLGADVKFSGTYVAQGYYDSNRALSSDDTATRLANGTGDSRQGASISDIWQRLRLQTDFQVAEGLKLVTQADIMERVWGNTTNATIDSAPSFTATGTANQESYDETTRNIRFRNAYVEANMLAGRVRVGYQTQTQWGTTFGDSGDLIFGPRIRYDYFTGPWQFIALYDWYDGTKPSPFNQSQNAAAQVDAQEDAPAAAFVYSWAKGNAGLLLKYVWNTTTSGTTAAAVANGLGGDQGFKTKYWLFLPYWKAQFGPVYTEGEVIYRYGKTVAYESDAFFNTIATQGVGDVTLNGWSGWAMASVDIKPAYVGGVFIYVEGDSPATAGSPNTTNTAGQPGGTDFNPCLMLFNYDEMRWNGGFGNPTYFASFPANSATGAAGISNAFIAQLFVGVKPIPKLDVKLAGTWARADKPVTNTGWVSKDYGYEADLTATYKIYDNLSYMVGFGYLWAGDFWKGTQALGTVSNDYLLTHKLTLSF